ncbi:MAG: hypothetical protein PHW88_06670 [Bacteroidales bacterium]|jgi:hypothetical protein|nr:hypothetical protein [Synergistaceae bacterium]MDD2330521.1 hypothetical protein [Bacteroidales bacterium]MDD3105475.1 hypothetical protein [Bacteroidales bacterium]MDD3550122.1 hypothetical protein [Bacteroidales bacterium]MDY0316378.1 hypothetical protein [Acholeplasmatales bacterium]
MKSVIGIFIVGLFTLLCGCDNSDKAVVGYAPEIEVLFVDNEGNVLHFDKDGKISLHDFVELDSKLNENGDKSFLEKSPLEVLSITDETGSPVKYRFDYKAGFQFKFTFTDNSVRKREYGYTIKYKIPLIKGETVEELKLKLKETEYGIPDGWYNCKYNGKDIRVYTITELFPDYNDPQVIIDKEKHNDRLREMLYNGDLAAISADVGILLSLPVDIVP